MATTTINGIPVFDALIDAENEGMRIVSLVDYPAVLSNFLAFDQNKKQLMYAVADEEKRLVFGVLMRADFPIYRKDESGEYYVIYKADTIRQMAEKYLKESRQNNVNIMHEDNSEVEGVQMVQYFIKDSAKGIAPEGFDVADGSLFAEYHVVNDEVWDNIKAGSYKGFSLEGLFTLVPDKDVQGVQEIVDNLDGQFSKQTKTNTKMTKMKKIKDLLRAALMAFGSVTTDKGVISWDGEEDLKAGDAVYIEDQEGNRVAAEDGDYITEDKKTIVVVDGKVAEIKDPEAEVEEQPAKGEDEQPAEEEQAMGSIDTDKGAISWNGEEDLKAGDEVFIEDENGEKVAAPDGEYVIADGKVIVVAEGKVAEIKDAEAEVEPEGEQEMKKKCRKAMKNSASFFDKIDAVYAALDEAYPEDYPYVADVAEDYCVAEFYGEGGSSFKRFAISFDEEGKCTLGESVDVKMMFVPVDMADPFKENEELRAQVAKLQAQPLASPAHEEVNAAAEVKMTGNKGLDRLANLLGAR